MNKTKNTLLWISVLLSSILGALLSYNIFKLVGAWCMKRYIENELFHFIYNELIANALAGAAFVLIGSHIAPCHKKHTALVLMIVVLILSILSAFSSFILHYEWYYYIASAALALGSVQSYVSVKKEEITE